MTPTKNIWWIISMSAMEHFLNKKYRSISEMEKDLWFLINYFVESNYIITRIDKYFYIAKKQNDTN